MSRKSTSPQESGENELLCSSPFINYRRLERCRTPEARPQARWACRGKLQIRLLPELLARSAELQAVTSLEEKLESTAPRMHSLGEMKPNSNARATLLLTEQQPQHRQNVCAQQRHLKHLQSMASSPGGFSTLIRQDCGSVAGQATHKNQHKNA